MMTAPQKNWFILQNDCVLLRKQTYTLLTDEDLSSFRAHFLRCIDLGEAQQIFYCCAELPQDELFPEQFELLPLRQVLSLFPQEAFYRMVKAYSVLLWDKNHQFCSRCGQRTQPQLKGFERKCIPCNLSFFPRISPSIIVLIKKGEHILLARSPHFLPGIYGLIAGFVEVGESIEAAVHREVMEEVGIKITNLTYVGSQPWPFPDSLMVAFTADYASGEITIDQDEIEDAGWYRYDRLPGRPGSMSIAAQMIDDFVRVNKA